MNPRKQYIAAMKQALDPNDTLMTVAVLDVLWFAYNKDRGLFPEYSSYEEWRGQFK